MKKAAKRQSSSSNTSSGSVQILTPTSDAAESGERKLRPRVSKQQQIDQSAADASVEMEVDGLLGTPTKDSGGAGPSGAAKQQQQRSVAKTAASASAWFTCKAGKMAGRLSEAHQLAKDLELQNCAGIIKIFISKVF